MKKLSSLRFRTQFWLIQLPVILFFTFCFWVTERGVMGRLENRIIREDIFPSLSRITNIWTDLKFKVRGPQPFKNKIVVVEVDSQSLEALGRWPWHRDVTAHVISRAFEQGAKVV
ncbi:MAG: CHASE2 domain-containing protein, partial [Bdellovibrio sp.]|nr:CHASE2 domain-containing protein [Bdellovibrio sp.]